MTEQAPGEKQNNALGAAQAAASTDAARSPAHGGGDAPPDFPGTGVSAALVIGVLLAILAIVVAVQNTSNVRVNFLAWNVDAPLVAVILTAIVAGVVLDETLGFFWRRRRRRHLAERSELRRLRRR